MSLRTTLARVSEKPFYWLFPSWLTYLQRDLAGCSTVLDVGCGNNSFVKYFPSKYSVGVDIHQPYLNESKLLGIHREYIRADIRELEFPAHSFDAVLMLALIEHMTKEDGLNLIRKAAKWAVQKVILTTPNGYIDHYKIDGNSYQEHICGWATRELQREGYTVNGTFGWKPLRGIQGKSNINPPILGETISGMTQWATYRLPSQSFVLYAVKEQK